MSAGTVTDVMRFEVWLRAECFQKPTPEAYDLAKCAWIAAISDDPLIAAAPELLEALRECQTRLSACRLIIEDDEARHMAAESVRKARVAISKATGATP